MRAAVPDNERARLEALRRYRILDTPPEQGFDDVTLLAAHVFGTPIALISLVDENRQWFKSKVGVDVNETPRDLSFCAHTLHEPGLCVIKDALEDPRFADNPFVTSGPRIRFYAAASLVTPDGLPLGTICVADRQPRSLSPEQADALRALGRQVMFQLELRRSVAELAEAISVLERAEDALRKSEDQYRLLFESNPQPMWVYDAENLRFVAVNHAAIQHYGYSAAEFLARTIKDIRPPEDLPALMVKLQDLPDGIVHTGLFRHRKKDGSVIDVEVTSHNLMFAGRPARLVLPKDITHRRRAEAALRETEMRYRLAARATKDAIWDWDLLKNEVKWNEGVSTLFGYAPGQVREDITWWYEGLHPEERERVVAGIHAQIDAGAEFWSDEYRFRGADGSYAYVLDRGYVMHDAGGKPVRMVGAMIDMTERMQAEAVLKEWKNRYEAAVQASGQILYDWHSASGHVTYGGSVERILGYSAEEIEGQVSRWCELLHPDDVEEFTQEIARTVEQRLPFHLEYRVRRKDGAYIFAKDDGYFIFDGAGSIVRMVGFITDVTEQKRLEEQLRHSQKMEAVGSLAGGVAHDFNNLLTAILGYCELLQGRLPEGDTLRREVGEIRKAGERASSLTRHLLAFSRRQMLQPRILDLNSVVNDMERMLRPLIGEDVELLISAGEDLGCVKADPGQIEQVILNLAVNARDAMPEGGRLTIETRNVYLDESYPDPYLSVASGPYVVLAVSDTGRGIDPEVQGRIFEPFFTTKEKGKGTGLGLSTVYGIVKQSGGDVWVTSERGKGSVFRVYLPRVPEAVPAEMPRLPVAERAIGSETVLLVEDEEMVRSLVHEFLRESGYTVLEAPDAEEALRVCEQHSGPIHLVVTDVVLPGMSGRDLARRLGIVSPDTRVLYMSGYTDDAVVGHGVVELGTAFLQKPFTPGALARKVREVLDARVRA